MGEQSFVDVGALIAQLEEELQRQDDLADGDPGTLLPTFDLLARLRRAFEAAYAASEQRASALAEDLRVEREVSRIMIGVLTDFSRLTTRMADAIEAYARISHTRALRDR